jgi:hypothetical protein
MTPTVRKEIMDTVFENPYVDAPEKPWTKGEVVASCALVFGTMCIASVAADKILTKLFKL